MKTAVSVQEKLFRRAEKFAKKKKLSRSQLYSNALEEYLAKRDNHDIVERINEVCELVGTSLEPALLKSQIRVLRKSK
jgi:metal-responsive CopG/Arc/MetJ family transcriptional regulator